jgi:hypothetical protein
MIGSNDEGDSRTLRAITPSEIRRCLDALFARAKQVDEFEYACALLRIRGMEEPGWDPLAETQVLASDLVGLGQAPLHPHTKARLGLLLYCHLTEADAVYEILENMLRTVDGDRASAWPFEHLRRGNIPPSAARVVGDLMEHARRSRRRKLVEIIEWEFNSKIRNAFFHSDYILHRDEFRSRAAFFDQPNGTYAPSLTLEQLEDQINRGLLFFQVFLDVFGAHVRSYRSDRQIEGRFGPASTLVPVTLLATAERGLYGLESRG